MKEGEWFRAVCHFHHLHPGSPGPAQVDRSSVGVYPDRDTFYSVGLPMVQELRREALVAFEDADESSPLKKTRIDTNE
jgi:hypothetical protein